MVSRPPAGSGNATVFRCCSSPLMRIRRRWNAPNWLRHSRLPASNPCLHAASLHTGIEIAMHKHQMELRLEESEAWLRATLASVADAVIVTDPQGQIRILNAAAQAAGWRRHPGGGLPTSPRRSGAAGHSSGRARTHSRAVSRTMGGGLGGSAQGRGRSHRRSRHAAEHYRPPPRGAAAPTIGKGGNGGPGRTGRWGRRRFRYADCR